MFKSRKIDEFGGQSGNEEKSEDVVVTEEKIIGDDGVERTVIKKTTTRRTIQTQQVSQGAKVTTFKKTVLTGDGKALTEEFQEHVTLEDNPTSKSIEHKKERSGSSSSSSSDDGFAQKIKSFIRGGDKKSKSKDGKKEEKSAIKDTNSPPILPSDGGKSKPSASSSSDKEPSSKATDDEKEFAEDCLQWHNYYRKKHGVKPLKLSAELSKYAKEWVTQIAKKDTMEHRPHNVYGENIFMKWSSDPKYNIAGRDPVENWYNEIKDHVYNVEPKSLKSGHFSQVIWKESEELGVAKAKSASGKIIVVANYNPAGNLIGSFAKNVPPPINK